jgi:hypothetical protein
MMYPGGLKRTSSYISTDSLSHRAIVALCKMESEIEEGEGGDGPRWLYLTPLSRRPAYAQLCHSPCFSTTSIYASILLGIRRLDKLPVGNRLCLVMGTSRCRDPCKLGSEKACSTSASLRDTYLHMPNPYLGITLAPTLPVTFKSRTLNHTRCQANQQSAPGAKNTSSRCKTTASKMRRCQRRNSTGSARMRILFPIMP